MLKGKTASPFQICCLGSVSRRGSFGTKKIDSAPIATSNGPAPSQSEPPSLHLPPLSIRASSSLLPPSSPANGPADFFSHSIRASLSPSSAGVNPSLLLSPSSVFTANSPR
ncbi:unnamed protein product [Linum trigynum]|uniref:Uncharacterized protein n=1 Tax=Linum trigynum TaxID=586398 RepID=A0AAV2DWZ8_9ROSI